MKQTSLSTRALLSRIMYCAICIIAMVIDIFVLLLAPSWSCTYQPRWYKTLLFFVFATFLFASVSLTLICALSNDRNKFIKLEYIGWFLIGLGVAVKIYWVISHKILPASDSQTFYQLALDMSRDFSIENSSYARYVAVFPHILGFPFLLSFVYKICGTDSYMVVVILNIVLTIICIWLLYKIGKILFSKTTGILAALFYAFLPSQTIYNMFVFSEPFYTALALLILYIFIALFKDFDKPQIWLIGIGIGLLLSILNTLRPIAPILIISFFICGTLFYLEKKKIHFKNMCVCFLIIICIYMIFNHAYTALMEKRLNCPIAKVTGWTIMVGFNEASGGSWNYEDSSLIGEYLISEMPADEVQEIMFSFALDRMKKADIPTLIQAKLLRLLATDSASIDYGSTSIAYTEDLRAICDGYYYGLWFMSLIGIIVLLTHDENKSTSFLILYIIGLVCAQMIVEVAPRYHYSICPFLCILSAYGLTKIKYHIMNLKERKTNDGGTEDSQFEYKR